MDRACYQSAVLSSDKNRSQHLHGGMYLPISVRLFWDNSVSPKKNPCWPFCWPPSWMSPNLGSHQISFFQSINIWPVALFRTSFLLTVWRGRRHLGISPFPTQMSSQSLWIQPWVFHHFLVHLVLPTLETFYNPMRAITQIFFSSAEIQDLVQICQLFMLNIFSKFDDIPYWLVSSPVLFVLESLFFF